MPRQKPAAVAPPGPDGSVIAFTAPVLADGDAVYPNNMLVVQNNSGATITLTIQTGGSAGNYAIADPTVTVAAATAKLIGPFDKALFAQPSGVDAGLVYIDYSAVTSVLRAVVAE